ncbi:glutaredoxin family protein [Chromobacterium haemolyticum]|uniref:Glutaredoxin family protein n=1 Tax=Chromobacterium fluminis TaxID=3044269 RepID=A0ABX0LC46_9NEIS|nr:glutaredoxin family protein [Chromobacterium haemolyticum]NHR07092.1 glutaredoxin family protein [Chromobacterium haemolyticum]OQS44501.1 thioredoxin family protein [Chromobacterium haemolyticum]
MRLTLYFREYCSLCHQMLAELQPWRERYGFELDVVDVDADPELERRFNELVPVLMEDETEICHWRLDQAALAAHLGEIG